MGVAGSGKSTVGAALADRLGLPYLDGDDLHPPANLARMRAGLPLRDDDRWPWLDAVGAWLAGRSGGGVVACSALRRRYRDRLRAVVPDLVIVHLHTTDPDLLRRRLAARRGHFLPPALLDSQLATLEPLEADERGVVLDLALPVDDLVRQACAAIAPSSDAPAGADD
ncbi:gluconokinase [Nocardioides fonticola]|uniref:Gluconokinase n=2 Tax=Nocardioides fonticola TaxID=450363 RepID=A0ABP7Y3F7_9ACTN